MKIRDSGMPEEGMWNNFFNPDFILQSFGLDRGLRDIAEFGSGYGTFTLSAARLVTGRIFAMDIDHEMADLVRNKCRSAGIDNVRVAVRDFVAEGSGLPENSVDAALLFNILHHEDPDALMNEAYRIIAGGGSLAVIHWVSDSFTPRGPSLDIRPRPEQCIEWGVKAGFSLDIKGRFRFPPYHYGLLFRKPPAGTNRGFGNFRNG